MPATAVQLAQAAADFTLPITLGHKASNHTHKTSARRLVTGVT
jgi:hypothetical protein